MILYVHNHPAQVRPIGAINGGASGVDGNAFLVIQLFCGSFLRHGQVLQSRREGKTFSPLWESLFDFFFFWIHREKVEQIACQLRLNILLSVSRPGCERSAPTR